LRIGVPLAVWRYRFEGFRFATRARLGVGRCRCDGDRQRGITNLFPLPLKYGMNRMDGMESVTRSMYRGSVGLNNSLLWGSRK